MAREFQDEDRILKMLNSLDNKHIIQLYISYKHKGVYNFLFPMADMDLECLLTRSSKSTQFQTDLAIVKALHGLGTAIASVHNFYSEKLDIEFKGCHHDLKPRNILVSGQKFILADFGLTRMKPLETDSKSISKNIGDYLAPECRAPNLRRLSIGRKSDVWSFACIIVELMAYMIGGPQAVTELRKIRTSVTAGSINHSFHSSGRVKDSVDKWLESQTMSSKDPNRSLLIDLAQRMLNHDPDKRPNAKTVQSTLRCLYAKLLLDTSLAIYERLVNLRKSPHLFFDSRQLKSWAIAVGLLQLRSPWRWASCDINLLSDAMVAALESVNAKLEEMSSETSTSRAGSTSQEDLLGGVSIEVLGDDDSNRNLHNAVQKLLDLLPPNSKRSFQSFLFTDLLRTNDPGTLREIESGAKNESDLRVIGAMAEMKQAIQMADGTGSIGKLKNRLPAGAEISKTRAFGDHETGEYSAPGIPSELVLVEWRPFNSARPQPPEHLLRRVDASANIPNIKSKPSEIRVLGCIGFYEDPHRRSFGIVYRLGQQLAGARQTQLEPVSLFELIASTKDTTRGKPYLGVRFAIARSIAECIQYCHSSNWVHKRLNSYNIVFLRSESSKAGLHSALPYLIGFNHSREDKDDEQSYGPPSDPAMIPYLHPDYIRTKRFKKLFDYYSVGVVLLEIGIWQTSKALGDEHPFHDSEGLQKEFVARYLPRLTDSMGEIYYRAVKACLTGELDNMDTIEDEVGNFFQMLVIDRLCKCVA